MLELFQEFGRNFGVADAADIAIVAVAIYFALFWLKRTASRSLYIGFAMLAVVYFLAGAFDLYLTLTVFNAIFAVLLLALVVVFQDDIRRAFERVGSLGTFSRRRTFDPAPAIVDMLVEMTDTLAAQKRGALMVLKGRDDLKRHIEGGVPLFGRVSKPLLLSLFDPHSAGHDGAVLIENNLLTKFSVHLPLARDRSRVGGLGTRHSAAVGLSECCDALVIVVSEERGVASIARGGTLTPCPSASELKLQIEQFLEEAHPQPGERTWKRLLTANLKTKLAAAFLAGLTWFAFGYQVETVQRLFPAAIEYRNVPEGMALGDFVPTEARITFSGSERAFRFLDPSTLRISVDASKAMGEYDEVSIDDRDVTKPSNLTVYRIEPRTVRLFLEKQ